MSSLSLFPKTHQNGHARVNVLFWLTYPDPGDYIESGEQYLREVAEDKDVDIAVRLQAATSIGNFQAYRETGKIQLLLQRRWALEDALIQHRRKFVQN